MDFNSVIKFMSQQLDALKNIEDLLAHDEKQNPAAHTVKPEEIEHLKNYVAKMKRAAETAKGLAEYYRDLEQAAAKKTEKDTSGDKKEPDKEPEQTEKPKPKRSRKKTAPSAEPPAESAANEPGPNGEQAEQTGIEADAKYETSPAPQVPVANPEPAQPAQQNIMDLIASISIDNLQG